MIGDDEVVKIALTDESHTLDNEDLLGVALIQPVTVGMEFFQIVRDLRVLRTFDEAVVVPNAFLAAAFKAKEQLRRDDLVIWILPDEDFAPFVSRVIPTFYDAVVRTDCR
jgi:hypothetical protein